MVFGHGSPEQGRQPTVPPSPAARDTLAVPRMRGTAAAISLAAAIPFLVYLRTMAPTVYGLDSAELTTGSYVLGVVHAPGSPTFLLLGHLFSWLPVGDVGYRVNLVSAVAAALAAGAFCAVLLRLLRDPIAATAGAWAFAFTYYFWISALSAELYALQALFLAVLIWLALRWRSEQRPWQLYLFALTFGIGLGNHLSLVVTAPGFALLLRSEKNNALPPLSRLAVAAACGLLGVSVYAYLPLRSHAPMNYARSFGVDVATWRGFWWMVTGQMFSSQMFAVPLAQLPGELASFAHRLFSNFTGAAALLGVLGAIDGARRSPVVHVGLAAIFLAHLGFVLTYDVADKELMLVPTFLVWAIWVALGARELAEQVLRRSAGRVAIPTAALLLMLAASSLWLNFARVDLSADWSARRRGEALLAYLPPRAVYVGSWADVPIIEYLQMVEKQRPDVEAVNVFLVKEARRRHLAERRLRSGVPVFAAKKQDLPDLGANFDYDPACDCYRVRAHPPSPGD